MRLLALTPIVVDDIELDRRQRRYDALTPPGVTVILERLEDGPRSLETEADVRDSEQALLARYRQVDPTGWHGFLPDCVLDPVVGLDHELAVPVFGLCRLASAFVSGQGSVLGAVARNRAIARELDRKLGEYGVRSARETMVLDLSVEDIADEARWAEAVTERLDKQADDMAFEYVLNACSAVEVADQSRAPFLLDPTKTALAMLGVRASAMAMTR